MTWRQLDVQDAETGNIARRLPTPTGGSFSIPQTTKFTLNVTAADFPTDFTKIDDLEVTLDIVDPHMNQLSIVLIPPTGSTLAPITLLSNLTSADGTNDTGTVGLPNLANLGIAHGRGRQHDLSSIMSARCSTTTHRVPSRTAPPRRPGSATSSRAARYRRPGDCRLFVQGTAANGFLSDVDGMSQRRATRT